MTTYLAVTGGWQSLLDGSIVSTLPPPAELQLIDPTSPPGVQPVGQASGWTLDFSDEFNATAVDTRKWDPWYPDNEFWATSVPGGHKTNTNEPQAYDPSAWSIGNSSITFTMRNEVTIEGLPYTSGMISSFPSYAIAYGYVEARIQLPRVQRSWPAFWMYPLNHSWPPEIDIMESWGGTVVGQNYIRPNIGSVGTGTGVHQISPGFHTYGILWEPGRLIWYVDGTEVFRHEGADVTGTEMIIFCNLAGDKDGLPDPSLMPWSMDVDYIRTWKAVE